MVDVDKTERRMAFRPFFLSREHYLGRGGIILKKTHHVCICRGIKKYVLLGCIIN